MLRTNKRCFCHTQKDSLFQQTVCAPVSLCVFGWGRPVCAWVYWRNTTSSVTSQAPSTSLKTCSLAGLELTEYARPVGQQARDSPLTCSALRVQAHTTMPGFFCVISGELNSGLIKPFINWAIWTTPFHKCDIRLQRPWKSVEKGWAI